MRFMILANPRSRTKWLSEYLSHGGQRLVGHDEMLGCEDTRSFCDKIRPLDGTVETSVALGYKLWEKKFPNTRFVIIHRIPIDVGASLAGLGFDPDWMFIYVQDVMLWQAANNIQNSQLFSFESLDRAEIRRELCDFVGVPFDHRWDTEMGPKRIEIDTAARVEALRSFSPARFYDDMAHKVIEIELSENEL